MAPIRMNTTCIQWIYHNSIRMSELKPIFINHLGSGVLISQQNDVLHVNHTISFFHTTSIHLDTFIHVEKMSYYMCLMSNANTCVFVAFSLQKLKQVLF